MVVCCSFDPNRSYLGPYASPQCFCRHAITDASPYIFRPIPPPYRPSTPRPPTVPTTISLSPVARFPPPSLNPRFASTRLRSTRTVLAEKNGSCSRITASQLNWNSFIATNGFGRGSVNAKGLILRRASKSEPFLPILFLLCVSPESIPCSVEPGVPFAPNHNHIPGQISTGFFQ